MNRVSENDTKSQKILLGFIVQEAGFFFVGGDPLRLVTFNLNVLKYDNAIKLSSVAYANFFS